jgi:hypothetical protein|tara:strand:+ start:108 stop:365 length:258 start_codon:yes stop_codon:yes gene_type:complete
MGKLILADGSIQKMDSPTLEQMQEAVGGYIEVIPCHYQAENEVYTMCIVNEEGIIHNLEPNMVASRICERPIVGPSIFLQANEMD